ncbi:MAG: hypothetical protein OXG13_04755 [Gemmatimonadaceae bacterium]|nr:hypothetical protein [Gemmatimonadaceae bacterium]
MVEQRPRRVALGQAQQNLVDEPQRLVVVLLLGLAASEALVFEGVELVAAGAAAGAFSVLGDGEGAPSG